MGNICCRRVVGYSPNVVEVDQCRCVPVHQQEQAAPLPQKISTMSGAYHNAGDDCAINELLEGRMDLDVILPDGRKVRLTVERRTPMMDLLVQAASSTKISPAGHTIHVFGEEGNLHYKPSTPIGSLDANTICIVSKKDDTAGRRAPKPPQRPFEPTFRVQVHLPRNQLTVARVSPRMRISELRSMVCSEKGLETTRYQLVRTSDHGQPLSGDMTLAEYGSTEISLLSNACIESHICNSTSHIMPYSKRSEEQKKKTGILRLIAEDANKNIKKLQSTTTTDSATHQQRSYKPKKRRPAPPPPPIPEPSNFHSRQSSSDSSGYHDAGSSCLHEEQLCNEKASSDSSGVSSLDAKVAPSVGIKKRKAPAPPPGGFKEDLKEAEKPIGNVEVAGVEATECPQVELQLVFEKDNNTQEVKDSPTEEVESQNIKDRTEKKKDQGDAVTNVALTALNARIEQDVTQQKIASSIQAAFHSLEHQKEPKPSLVSIKQKRVVQEPLKEVKLCATVPPPELKDSKPKVRLEITTWNSGRDKVVTPAEPVRSEPVQQIPTRTCNPSRKDSKLIVPKPLSGYSKQHKNLKPTATVEVQKISDIKSKETITQNSYPLQKSTARLTINLERKLEALENGLDAVVPPPTEFDDNTDDKKTLTTPKHSTTLRRSSSLLSLTDSEHHSATRLKASKQLQRSLSDIKKADDRSEFEAEQERLQKEYLKLQRQFILWQEQLLSNHAMLREECLVPTYARTFRQSHSLPEGEDYSDQTSSRPCPLVSRSLSYEPNRCSTLPRSTINIPPLEFGTISIGNGTLRSSKTKSYFKPPQARISTKNRQRLPPEIKKDGELDIYDDTKILSTILPTFESLKKISESNDDESDFRSKQVPYTNGTSKMVNGNSAESKKIPPPVPSKQSKLSSETARNGLRTINVEINGQKVHTNGVKTVSIGQESKSSLNGSIHLPKTIVNGESKLLLGTFQTPVQQPIPPPPLLRTTNGTLPYKVGGATIKEKKIVAPQLDSRDQLMQEIRRCGGRTALRKISLDLVS